MTMTIQATFDGQVFRPDQPPTLPPNTRVEITIKSLGEEKKVKTPPTSFLDAALSVDLNGPPDWSENLHDYLHGGKKFPDE